jgi:hypothetical protein
MPNRGQRLALVACEILANIGVSDIFVASDRSSFLLPQLMLLFCSTIGMYVFAAIVVFTVCFLCHRKGKLLAAAFATRLSVRALAVGATSHEPRPG